MPYNLFIEHHIKLQSLKKKKGNQGEGIGSGWEDDFTNILSFYLSSDEEALNAFCRLALGGDFKKPIEIETQESTAEGRPDIIIRLESGSLLVVECKIDALLQPMQLERYLAIGQYPKQKTFVTLFSKRWIDVPKAVLEIRNFKRPPQLPHFFWTDLYRAIPKPRSDSYGVDLLRSLFLDYMELLGLSPSSLNENWSKLFEDRTIEENQKVQKEFGHKLSLTRAWLRKRNFKVTAVSHQGLQAVPKAGPLLETKAPVKFIVITPARSRKDLMLREHATKLNAEVLRLALVFDFPEPTEFIQQLYENFPNPLKDQNDNCWWPTRPYKFSKKRVRLEFVSNLDRYLDNDFEIDEKVKIGCVTVIEHIHITIEQPM